MSRAEILLFHYEKNDQLVAKKRGKEKGISHVAMMLTSSHPKPSRDSTQSLAKLQWHSSQKEKKKILKSEPQKAPSI